MANQMNSIRQMVCLGAIFSLGLTVGIAAESGVGSLLFDKLTLAASIRKVHQVTPINVAYVEDDTKDEKTFRIDVHSPKANLNAAARQYGLEPIQVGRVYVLRRSIPEGRTANKRLASINDWLRDELPGPSADAEGAETGSALAAFGKAHTSQLQAFAGSLGSTDRRFDSLTPGQQQILLDLWRYSSTKIAASVLNQMLAEQADMDRNSKTTVHIGNRIINP